MVSLRSDEEILRSFEGLDTVPGSKKKRVEDTTKAEKLRSKAFGESNGWDANPIKKYLGGEKVEFFTVGALAQALEKTVVTVRLWEKRGYIPVAPYRFKEKTLNGKAVSGNRAYTRELVEIAIEEFEKRKLLGTARVEWNQLQDLTDSLVHRWRLAVNRES